MKRPESRVWFIAWLFCYLLVSAFRKAAPMPLQHTHEHEEQPAPLSAFSTSAAQETVQETAPPPSLAANEAADAPRYDAATVKQIIALAEQMQTHHRQTLTPDEVEALGHEVGVEPQFIRRALAQMAAPTPVITPAMASSTASYAQQSSQAVAELSIAFFLSSLTRKQARLLTVPLALYLMALPYTLGRFDLGDRQSLLAPVLLYIVIPTVLALYLGGKGKSHRFGMLVGALMGLTAVLSAIVANDVRFHVSPPPSELLNMFASWIGAGLALGFVGAATGKVARRVRSKTGQRRRLRVHVVMEAAE